MIRGPVQVHIPSQSSDTKQNEGLDVQISPISRAQVPEHVQRQPPGTGGIVGQQAGAETHVHQPAAEAHASEHDHGSLQTSLGLASYALLLKPL